MGEAGEPRGRPREGEDGERRERETENMCAKERERSLALWLLFLKDKTTGSGTQDNTDKYKNKHSSHLWGNIGVTTSAQMLQGELDVRRFNIYSQIADIFVSEFCILVY